MSEQTAEAVQVTFSSVIVAYGQRHNMNTTDAGKALRGKLRAMGDAAVQENWPQFVASGKQLRDGNRYPLAMPRDFAVSLINTRRAQVTLALPEGTEELSIDDVPDVDDIDANADDDDVIDDDETEDDETDDDE